MKNKHKLIFVNIILIFFSVFFAVYNLYNPDVLNTKTNTQMPKLFVDRDTCFFGKVAEGDTVSCKVEITNEGNKDLIIHRLRTSCGCTSYLLDEKVIKPRCSTTLVLKFNTSYRKGENLKSATIYTNGGNATVYLQADIYPITKANHPKTFNDANLFEGSCAKCHSHPAKGKTGRQLYEAVCGYCHGENREGGLDGRSPSLKIADVGSYSNEELYDVIYHGIEESSMPPFALKYYGPLTNGQITSCVDYLKGIR